MVQNDDEGQDVWLDLRWDGTLREWDLAGVAGDLAENGFETRTRVMLMEDEDIKELGLRPGDKRLLKKLLQSLHKEVEDGAKQAHGTNTSQV